VRSLVKKDELLMQPLDVNEVIREAVGFVQSDALIKGVQIDLKLARELAPIQGDRVQLQQVLLNLIMNAFDALSAVEGERTLTIQATHMPEKGWL
jgi:two-component system sensor kinase FixL